MKQNLSKNKKSYYIHTVIMLAIAVAFYFIPAVEPLTPLGMKVLGVFLAMLYGWLFCDVVWPSLFGLLMLGVCGYDKVGIVFASAYGNSTVIMLILFCAVTAILSAAGIAEYIANKMISLKILQGRPYVLMLVLLLVMVVLALTVGATAGFLIILPLIKEISKNFGYKPGDKWPMYMILSAAYIDCVSYQLLPFKAGPALVYGSYTQFSGVEDINYVAYMICVFAMLVAAIAACVLFCKFVIRPDVSCIQNSASAVSGGVGKSAETLSSYQKYVLVSFLVLMIALLWPNVAPASWGITTFLKNLTTNGILMAYIMIYLFFNFKEGIGFKTILSRDMAWPAIYLVGAAMTMASAFQSEATGIMAWIEKLVTPLVEGQNIYVFVLIIMVLSIVMTNIANNMATLAIFTPLAYTIGMSTGANIQMEALMLCVLMTGATGLITPPASSISAYMYGEKEWLPGNCVFKYGALFCCVFNLIIIYIFGFGLGSLLF